MRHEVQKSGEEMSEKKQKTVRLKLPDLNDLERDFVGAYDVAFKSKDRLLATMLYRTALDVHAVKAMIEMRKVEVTK